MPSSNSSSPLSSPLRARFSSSSPTPSSSSSISHMPLRMADVANLFIKMRRHQTRAKQRRIESSSGEWPRTHPGLEGDGAVSARKVPLVQEDTFVCRDGVDAVKLLRLVRATLYEEAQAIGANVLVDERWSCTISMYRYDSRMFRVYIRYEASAARSDMRDPQKPVALERAQGVPGLMTILDRQD